MDQPISPISFSPVIVGTMRLGKWGANLSTQELETYVNDCLEMGLQDFDHADIYGDYTEEGHFGEVLKRRPALRQQMRITTKCSILMPCDNRPSYKIKGYDTSKEHIISSAENSLKELGTDYIDLLLIHRPDYMMNPHEIADAFESLKKDGKVLHFGVSNFTPTQVEMLHSFFPIVNNQVEISVTKLDAFTDGTLDKCWQHNIVPTAWSPLGGGTVFGLTDDPKILRIREVAMKLSKKYEAGLDQILLAWLMKHPIGIVPVIGSSKITRIKSALAAAQINLSREEWYELWSASTGKRVP